MVGAVVLAVGLLKVQAQKPLTSMSPDEVASVAVRVVDASTLAKHKYVWKSEAESSAFDARGSRNFHFQETSQVAMVDSVEYTLSAIQGGHEMSPSDLELSRQRFQQFHADFMKRFDFDHDAIVGRLPRLLAKAFVSTVTGPETADGHSCVVLRSVPKDEGRLVSVRVWMDIETMRLVRTEIVAKGSPFIRTTTDYGWIGGDDLEVRTVGEALNERGGVSGSWKSTTTLSAYAPRPANVVATPVSDR
jgi:hypothetical protein